MPRHEKAPSGAFFSSSVLYRIWTNGGFNLRFMISTRTLAQAVMRIAIIGDMKQQGM